MKAISQLHLARKRVWLWWASMCQVSSTTLSEAVLSEAWLGSSLDFNISASAWLSHMRPLTSSRAVICVSLAALPKFIFASFWGSMTVWVASAGVCRDAASQTVCLKRNALSQRRQLWPRLKSRCFISWTPTHNFGIGWLLPVSLLVLEPFEWKWDKYLIRTRACGSWSCMG